MAKKEAFDPIKWQRRQQRQLNARGKAIKELFDDLAQRASLLGIDVNLPSDKDFEFKNYPALEQRADKLVRELAQKVTRIIEDGEEEAWLEANAKNDALVDSVVKGTGLPNEVVSQWKQPNLNALEAFQARKIAGMGLSKRVWALTNTAKQELELALDLGIGEGKSAAELSRDIRKYLNEPNKLFRRVRDEKGILRLSKAAKMYHPGRGVYRSSYKNALRLTQTEINMAYHSADHERWSQTDWIIGVRVSLSNNHTLNGIPFHDICNDVKGVYPKDFKFIGWHPKCRCHATPELAKREERIAYLKKMANGEDVSDFKFSGQTKEVPQGFNDWVGKNAERIKGAEERGKLPYFLRDNGKFFTHDKGGMLKLAPRKKTPLEIAEERHAMRTPEQAKEIQDRWKAKLAQDNLTKKTASNVLNVAKEYPEVNIATLQQYIVDRDLKRMKLEASKVAKEVAIVKKDERFLEQLIPDVHEWKKQFTSAELHAVYDAVEKTLDKINNEQLNMLKYSNILQQKKNLIIKEIKYVSDPNYLKPHSLYPTWKVSQSAFNKQLEIILDELEWEVIDNTLQESLTFKTKSKIFYSLLDELKNAISQKDKVKAQMTIAKIEAKRNQLQKAIVAREKKKVKSVFNDDAYSVERKNNALWSTKKDKYGLYDRQTGDDYFRPFAEQDWKRWDSNQKDVAYLYTSGSSYINEPLYVKYYGTKYGLRGEIRDSWTDINTLTEMIDKSTPFTRDVWLNRGAGAGEFLGQFGVSLNNYKSNPSALIGLIGEQKCFMSTAHSKSWGFVDDGKEATRAVVYNIYCPQGTKGIYTEPYSAYGSGNRSWNGKDVTPLRNEVEVILQRNTRLRIIKAECVVSSKFPNGQWFIDMEVIGQPSF